MIPAKIPRLVLNVVRNLTALDSNVREKGPKTNIYIYMHKILGIKIICFSKQFFAINIQYDICTYVFYRLLSEQVSKKKINENCKMLRDYIV